MGRGDGSHRAATATLAPRRRGQEQDQQSRAARVIARRNQAFEEVNNQIEEIVASGRWQVARFFDQPYKLPSGDLELGERFLDSIEDKILELGAQGETLSDTLLEKVFVDAAREEGWGAWKDSKLDNKVNDVYLLSTREGALSETLQKIVDDDQDNINWYEGKPHLSNDAVAKFSLNEQEIEEIKQELKDKAAPASCKSDSKPTAVLATKVKIDEVPQESSGRLWDRGEERSLAKTRQEEIAALDTERAVQQIGEIAKHLDDSHFMVQTSPTFFQDQEDQFKPGEVATSMSIIDTRYPAKVLNKLVSGNPSSAKELYQRADRLGVAIEQTSKGGLSIHIPDPDNNQAGFKHTVHLSTKNGGDRFLSTNTSSLDMLTMTRGPLLSHSEGVRQGSQKQNSANVLVAKCRQSYLSGNWGKKTMFWHSDQKFSLWD